MLPAGARRPHRSRLVRRTPMAVPVGGNRREEVAAAHRRPAADEPAPAPAGPRNRIRRTRVPCAVADRRITPAPDEPPSASAPGSTQRRGCTLYVVWSRAAERRAGYAAGMGSDERRSGTREARCAVEPAQAHLRRDRLTSAAGPAHICAGTGPHLRRDRRMANRPLGRSHCHYNGRQPPPFQSGSFGTFQRALARLPR
jgi:hypothetical protein